MKAAQLKCLAWTFSAFLPKDSDNGNTNDAANDDEDEDYYHLLGLKSKSATSDEIRRAYKKKSLQLHPDKIAQRGGRTPSGKVKTEEEIRRDFQKVKEAYETLSDPRKREVYDALGPVGTTFLSNPGAAMDPHVLLDNLSKSNFCDKTKLMVLVTLVILIVLCQPILICAKVDQDLRGSGVLSETGWVLVLIPLWLLNLVMLLLSFAVMAQIQLRSFANFSPLLKLVCAILTEIFLALKWDGTVTWSYAIVLIPLFILEVVRIIDAVCWISRINKDVGRMVTIEYLEGTILPEREQERRQADEEEGPAPGHARLYADLTEDERDAINKEFIIVHCPPHPVAGDPSNDEEVEAEINDERIALSPEYQSAMTLLGSSYALIRNILVIHTTTLVLLVFKADGIRDDWSWWIVSVPLWIQIGFTMMRSCLTCCCTAVSGAEEEEGGIVVMMDDDDDDNGGDDGDDDDAKDGDGDEPLVPPAPSPAKSAAASTDPSSTATTPTPAAAASAPASAPALEPEPTTADAMTEDERKQRIESELESCKSMKASELKAELKARGVPMSTFVEKSEFIAALAEARVDGRGDAAAAAAASAAAAAAAGAGKAEKNAAKNSEEKFAEEEKANMDDGDDDERSSSSSSESSEVYIDEETFRAWQSAQAESDAKASEVAAKACGTCCLQVFFAMMLALFVAKLAGEDVDTVPPDGGGSGDGGANSYSAFWILFPFLLFAALILCCCCCSIYCAAGVEGLEENAKRMASTKGRSGGAGGDGDDGEGGADEEAPEEGEGATTDAAAMAAALEEVVTAVAASAIVGAGDADGSKPDRSGEGATAKSAAAGQADDARSNASSDDLD